MNNDKNASEYFLQALEIVLFSFLNMIACSGGSWWKWPGGLRKFHLWL